MRGLIARSVCLLALSVCIVMPAAAAELIVNGSFEDPQAGGAYQYHPGESTDIMGWTTINTGVEKFVPAVVFVGSSAQNGNYVLDLNTDFGVGGGIQQTVGTNPGQTYVLSYYIGTFFSRGRSGVANIDAVINGSPHPETYVSLTENITWEQVVVTFVATSTSTTISFQNFDLPNSTFSLLDAVSLTGMPIAAPDLDEDGVFDDVDECPNTSQTGTLMIDGCDTGIINSVSASGCGLSDAIGLCAAGAKNHGAWVSCVAHLTNDWKKAGLITGQQKGAIQSCAAKADIP